MNEGFGKLPVIICRQWSKIAENQLASGNFPKQGF